MTISVKHKFTSAKTDGADTSLVRPSNWNDEHDLTLAASKLLGRATASTGAAEEISIGSSLILDAATQTLKRAALTGDVTASEDSNSLTIANGAVTAAKIGSGAATLAKLDTTGTSGFVLTAQGAGSAPVWAAASGGGTGRLLRAPQILTSGTSYTTPAGCTAIYVEAVGGGAAGFAPGAGGGSGGYAAKYFTVSASTAYTYAIGAGGSGGNGTAGGNTTFTVGATTVTATGGSGTTGGTPTNGDVNIRGSNGSPAAETNQGGGGSGGASFFGGSGGGGAGNTTAGGAANSGTAGVAGGGGGGGGHAQGSGSSDGGRGNGGAGLIRIWEYA
jgi:hypothetical protein